MNLVMLIIRLVETITMVIVVIISVWIGIRLIVHGDLFEGMLILIAGQLLSAVAKIMQDHARRLEIEDYKDRATYRRGGYTA